MSLTTHHYNPSNGNCFRYIDVSFTRNGELWDRDYRITWWTTCSHCWINHWTTLQIKYWHSVDRKWPPRGQCDLTKVDENNPTPHQATDSLLTGECRKTPRWKAVCHQWASYTELGEHGALFYRSRKPLWRSLTSLLLLELLFDMSTSNIELCYRLSFTQTLLALLAVYQFIPRKWLII